MKNRNQYEEIEDFFEDESFQLWIIQKIDEQEWQKWSYENLERAKLVQKARFMTLSINLPCEPLNNIEKPLLNSIKKRKWFAKI